MANEPIHIEVTYAIFAEQALLNLEVAADCSIEQAIKQSGILARFPDIDLSKNKVGIFGKITPLANQLRDKDRVEIYRPLIADPKEVRRKRAAEGKRMRKGGGDVDDKKA